MIRVQKLFSQQFSHFVGSANAGLAQASDTGRMVHILDAVNPFYGLIGMHVGHGYQFCLFVALLGAALKVG